MKLNKCGRAHIAVFLLAIMLTSVLCGCSAGGVTPSNSGEPRQTLHNFLLPEASGELTYGDSLSTIDASHISEGYVMICYHGTADNAKILITGPTGNVYTYSLSGNSYQAFPLSCGSGSYHIDIYEHAYDDMYAVIFSQDVDVALSDEFKPFLYPNQYSWYTQDSETAQLGITLSDQSTGDLDFVEQVYQYIISNIAYDTALAANIPADYIPDTDKTLQKGSGVCFDYAALMTALLRSQGIPTKLEVGYSGTSYHAWISVYLKESGWVDNIIKFDGASWSLMDPTLAASNTDSSDALREYVGDGTNYTVKYSY